MKQEENTPSNQKIYLNDFSSYHFFNDTAEVSENSFDTPEDEPQSPSTLLPSSDQPQEDLLQFDFLKYDPNDTPNPLSRSSIGSFSTFSSFNTVYVYVGLPTL